MASMQAIGFSDSAAATREARKYIASENPDFTLSDVTTFYDDADTLSWGWRAVWGEDSEGGEPVPEGDRVGFPGWETVEGGPVEDDAEVDEPAPVVHVAPEIAEAFGSIGVRVDPDTGEETQWGLVAIQGGKGQAEPEYADPLTAPMDAPQAGDVFLRVSGSMSRTEAAMLANMISGKLAGVTLEVVDGISGNVVQTFEGKSARKAGVARGVGSSREARDWTIKPVITGVNAGAQSRLDRIEAASGDYLALRAELDKISTTSVQTYSVQARKYCEALLVEAKPAWDEEQARLDAEFGSRLAAD